MHIFYIALIAIASYLIGNVQCGVVIARSCGVEDIRRVGSGGTGATNVLRNVGLFPALLTCALDVLKGYLPTIAAGWLMGEVAAYVAGICAVLGHVFPVFYRFKGGKGVSTSLGALLAVNPIPALIGMVASFAAIVAVRIVSVVSLTASFIMMLYIIISHPGNVYYMVFGIAIFLLIVYCHRENIKRLIAGTEKRISFKRRVIPPEQPKQAEGKTDGRA